VLGAASQCKNLTTFMEMKPKRIPLGRNPLSDAPCRNPGMVLNEQGPGHHPRDAPCHSDVAMHYLFLPCRFSISAINRAKQRTPLPHI